MLKFSNFGFGNYGKLLIFVMLILKYYKYESKSIKVFWKADKGIWRVL